MFIFIYVKMKTLLHYMLWEFYLFCITNHNHISFLQVNVRLTILIKEIWMKKTAQQIIMGIVLKLCINHRYRFRVSISMFFKYCTVFPRAVVLFKKMSIVDFKQGFIYRLLMNNAEILSKISALNICNLSTSGQLSAARKRRK